MEFDKRLSLDETEATYKHQWWCGGKEPCACSEGWKEKQRRKMEEKEKYELGPEMVIPFKCMHNWQFLRAETERRLEAYWVSGDRVVCASIKPGEIFDKYSASGKSPNLQHVTDVPVADIFYCTRCLEYRRVER